MKIQVMAVVVALVASNGAHCKGLDDYVDDVRDYAVAPLHWNRSQWLLAGEAVGATAAAYSFDSRVRSDFAPPRGTVNGDPHSLRDSAPFALLTAATLAAGAISDRPELRGVAYDMTEAVALSTVSAFAFKHAFGRIRPDATMDSSAWRAGGDSFPSGHTAAAFAAAQVFADSRPSSQWYWKAFAYSIGAATAYARLDGNMHWLSDTVAGAALGMATGRFISSRGERGDSSPLTIGVQPAKGGAILTFSIDPYRN